MDVSVRARNYNGLRGPPVRETVARPVPLFRLAFLVLRESRCIPVPRRIDKKEREPRIVRAPPFPRERRKSLPVVDFVLESNLNYRVGKRRGRCVCRKAQLNRVEEGTISRGQLGGLSMIRVPLLRDNDSIRSTRRIIAVTVATRVSLSGHANQSTERTFNCSKSEFRLFDISSNSGLDRPR